MSSPAPRVLLVDDDDRVLHLLKLMLSSEAYEIEFARDGHEALEKIAQGDYAAIVCDLGMPRMDGQALYRELEQRQPDLLKRLVFVSGDEGSPEHEAFFKQTRARLLQKPFKAADFRAVVGSLVPRSGA
jgi:CheY-like chemotaxis protein